MQRTHSHCTPVRLPRLDGMLPLSWLNGNTLDAQQRLDAGGATGALVLITDKGVRVRAVRTPASGRGLVAHDALPAGTAVCTLPGDLVEAQDQPGGGVEVFLARAPRAGAPARWLVLRPPTVEAPGSLANTSTGADGGNNCRFAYSRGAAHATLVTTRAVAAGEELLVAYGSGYTKALRARAAAAAADAAAAPAPFDRVACAACGTSVQAKDLSRHARGFACSARRAGGKP
jgi:hypothetical protein